MTTLYTIAEATQFGPSRKTLYRWLARGYLKASISATDKPIVSEQAVRCAARIAKEEGSRHISAGVNRALGKEMP